MQGANNADSESLHEDSCGCGADTGHTEAQESASNDMPLTDIPEPTSNDEQPKEHSELDECKDKLARTMADYENMLRQKDHDIELRSSARINSVMGDILQIHDDVERAHDAFGESGNVALGLDGILKNIRSLFAKNNVIEIDALGEHFDPKKHESIKVVDDDTLEDGTITKVARKGYICHDQVLRPSLVEISRRNTS